MARVKPDLTDLQACVLMTIRENPGIRAGAIEANWRVVASFRASPPKGVEPAKMRAVDRALQALRRAGLAEYRSGWHATKNGRGAL